MELANRPDRAPARDRGQLAKGGWAVGFTYEFSLLTSQTQAFLF